MTITVNQPNSSYVNVSAPWRLGEYPKEQTEQERQEFKKLVGQHLKVSDKTFEMLNSVEPYTVIPYKGMSFDSAMSKVCKYYIDSNSGQNLEQIRELNKQKVDKIISLVPKQEPLSYDFRREYRNNTIWCQVDTYSLLEHISSNYFATNPERRHMTGYFGGTEDTVLQVVLEYFIKNNPDKKQSIKK